METGRSGFFPMLSFLYSKVKSTRYMIKDEDKGTRYIMVKYEDKGTRYMRIRVPRYMIRYEDKVPLEG